MKRRGRTVMNSTQGPRRRPDEAGFSLLELVIVMSIMIIMMGMALWTFAPRRRAFAADDAAAQVLDFVRMANQRALAERQPMLLEINPTNETIRLTDENGAGAGDDVVLREESLLPVAEVAIRKPTANAPAALPTPFAATAVNADSQLVSGTWRARFLSTGSMTKPSDGSLQTTAFYFWQPPGNNASATGPSSTADVRVATVSGASSSTKLLRYTGSAWVRR
jgi:type II secretory pathway pseudopilin PulG